MISPVHGPAWRTRWPWLAPSIFLAVFFFIPLVRILWQGLGAVSLPVLLDETGARAMQVLGFTFFQAALSTILTLFFGLPLAFLFARYNFPLKGFLHTLTAVPFLLPTVVVAAGFNALLGPRGWLNLILLDGLGWPPILFLNSLPAILTAHVFYNTIIVVRLVSTALQQMDARLPDAARMLGAGNLQAFWRVTLPVIWPAILAAGVLVFLFDFSSFGVILLLGGPRFSTIEVEIYIQALQFLNLPAAAFLSLLQLACTLGLSALYSRYVLPGGSPDNSARTRTSYTRPPISFPEKGLVRLAALVILLFFGLPLVSLPARAFLQWEGGWPVLTLQFFEMLFQNPRGSLFYVPPFTAAWNSLQYAFITVVLSLLLGFPLARLLVKPGRLEKWLDPLLMLPLGASAVTLGLGYIITFNRALWPGGSTLLTWPWLLPLAHTTIALPFVVRNLQSALAAIPNRYREAAAVLGASPWQVWRQVDWPIISRALVSAGAFAFTVSLGEFGAASLLARPETPTLPTAIYRFLSQPGALNYGQAMAMATLLLLLAGLGIWLIERFRVSGEL